VVSTCEAGITIVERKLVSSGAKRASKERVPMALTQSQIEKKLSN
jgi:hypothetical protein